MEREMKRSISWVHGFMITTGVIIGMVASIGGLVAQVGSPSIIIWPITAIFGLILAFSYAELATMFPSKSGGISIYGAEAWKDKSPLFGVLTVWGYWFGWSPGMAIFALLSGDYVHTLAPKIPAYGFGAAVLIILFIINCFGILESAVSQIVLAIVSMIPLLIIAFFPLFRGQVVVHNFVPFLPLGHPWLSSIGIELVLGGMFVSAWTTYASEGAVAFGSEYRNPSKDLPRAIISIALFLFILCTALPFILLGVLGQQKVLQDPSVAMLPLAREVFGGAAGTGWIVILILMLILNMNSSMLTSSRALYQMSADGYTFKFLTRLNRRGVPARAMAFDVAVNLLLMLLGTPLFILAASNVGYMLALPIITGGALRLRKTAPAMERPFRVRMPMLWAAFVVALFGVVMLIGGIYTWGLKNIGIGIIVLLISIPIYYFRKYVEEPWADKRAGIGSGEAVPVTKDPQG